MKVIDIIYDNESSPDVDELVNRIHQEVPEGVAMVMTANKDSRERSSSRRANNVIHTYAVTQLPFVVLSDYDREDGDRVYAALYSEEGPITIERIQEKL